MKQLVAFLCGLFIVAGVALDSLESGAINGFDWVWLLGGSILMFTSTFPFLLSYLAALFTLAVIVCRSIFIPGGFNPIATLVFLVGTIVIVLIPFHRYEVKNE